MRSPTPMISRESSQVDINVVTHTKRNGAYVVCVSVRLYKGGREELTK